MTSIKQKKLQQKLTEDIYRHTHFSKPEVEFLLKRYNELTKNCKGLDRIRFRDILSTQFNMTDDNIMDRIFRAFDKDNDTTISMEEWIHGLSVFLRGTLEEHMKFAFAVFDMNNDGWIQREEMFQLLKQSLSPKGFLEEDPEEGVRDLVEICLKKLDADHDNRVSIEDFMTSVQEDTLLLECLGTCLPSHKCKCHFEEQIKERTSYYNDLRY